MKVYALYYKDDFIVAYENREDCIDFGKRHYEGYEWDCSIVERWLYETKQYAFSQPLTQPLTQPVPYTPYSQPIPSIPLKATWYGWYGWYGPGTK